MTAPNEMCRPSLATSNQEEPMKVQKIDKVYLSKEHQGIVAKVRIPSVSKKS